MAWAGAVVFLVSLPMHEALILLWPALALGLSLMPREDRGLAWGLGTLTACGGALIVVILGAQPTPDPAALCAAARLNHCPYPFRFLAFDFRESLSYLRDRRSGGEARHYLLLALLSVLPLAGVRFGSSAWGRLVPLVPVVAVLPLFPVGLDWGRWIHLGVFPASLVALAAVLRGRASHRRVLPPWLMIAYVGSWSIPHYAVTQYTRALWIWPVLGMLWLAHRARTAWAARKSAG